MTGRRKTLDITAQYWAATATKILTNQSWNDIKTQVRNRLKTKNRRQKNRRHADLHHRRKQIRARQKQTPKNLVVGSWNTRQLGATHGKIDPHLKLKHMTNLWEKRGWDAALLSDVKFGARGSLEFEGNKQTWLIIYRGKVAVALSGKLASAWREQGGTVNTDGKGNNCRTMMVNTPKTNKWAYRSPRCTCQHPQKTTRKSITYMKM